MHRLVPPVLARAATAAAAIAALLVVAHWVLVHPALAPAQSLKSPVFIALLVGTVGSEPGPPEAYRQFNLALLGFTAACAAALSLFVLAKAEQTAATRRLAFALASGALAAIYFFFLATHSAYGIDAWPAALRHAARVVGYWLAFGAAVQMARFFQSYPRLPTLEERRAYHRAMHEERLASARRRWGWKGTQSSDFPEGSWSRRWRAWLEGELLEGNTKTLMQHRAILAVVPCLAAFSALADARPFASADDNALVLAILWGLDFMLLYMAAAEAFGGLQFHHRRALASEQARMDWLYGTMLVAGIVAVTVTPLWWAVLAVALPHVEVGVSAVSPALVLLGPTVVNVELFVLASLLALALSIFYRGALDPRLALRRITLFTIVGIGVALAFVVAERAVAVRLVAWLQLPMESGAFIAGVLVAVTLSPLRSTAERGANRFIARVLPLATLMDGERGAKAVVLCDLSGYTRLSATDEKQAMLLAALLQRLAATVARENGGKLVKTMGDAVLLSFADAASAARAVLALHERYPPAAAALGLAPLALHSGAHYGEVVQTHDGDLYGQTVNVAARLQGSATESEAIVSAAFAQSAGTGWSFRPLGLRTFKNVPEPMECFALEPRLAPATSMGTNDAQPAIAS